MEPLKVIEVTTPPGTRVLVVGDEGWEILAGELVSLSPTGHMATIRGRDGQEHKHLSYSVHIYPEATS